MVQSPSENDIDLGRWMDNTVPVSGSSVRAYLWVLRYLEIRHLVTMLILYNNLWGGAMAAEFNVGDEVFLKVGGPKMVVDTVVEHRGKFTFRCQWFAGKKLDNGTFQAESLVREDPNPKVQPGA